MKLQIKDKVWCKIKAISNVQLLCTINMIVDKVVVVELPCEMKGFKVCTISIKDIVSKQEPVKKIHIPRTPAPIESPFGRVKQRLLQIQSVYKVFETHNDEWICINCVESGYVIESSFILKEGQSFTCNSCSKEIHHIPRTPEKTKSSIIQKQATKQDNCIFSLMNENDLTKEEKKLIQNMRKK